MVAGWQNTKLIYTEGEAHEKLYGSQYQQNLNSSPFFVYYKIGTQTALNGSKQHSSPQFREAKKKKRKKDGK